MPDLPEGMDWRRIVAAPFWKDIFEPFLLKHREASRQEMIEHFDLDMIRIAQGKAQAFDEIIMSVRQMAAREELLERNQAEAMEDDDNGRGIWTKRRAKRLG